MKHLPYYKMDWSLIFCIVAVILMAVGIGFMIPGYVQDKKWMRITGYTLIGVGLAVVIVMFIVLLTSREKYHLPPLPFSHDNVKGVNHIMA
jgi:F0F1-type ATP synthase assembly protein I